MSKGRKLSKPVIIERLIKIIKAVREKDFREQGELQRETKVPNLYIRLCLNMDIIRKTDKYYNSYINLDKVDDIFLNEIYILFMSYYRRYTKREGNDTNSYNLWQDVEDAYSRAMRRWQITPKFNKTEYPLALEEACENKLKGKFKYPDISKTKKPSLWTRIKNLFQ